MLSLTKEQKQHQKSINWLLCGGSRTGRTFVLADTFLKIAFHDKDNWHYVFDHTGNEQTLKHSLIAQMETIFKKNYDQDKYKLKIEREAMHPYKIRIEKSDSAIAIDSAIDSTKKEGEIAQLKDEVKKLGVNLRTSANTLAVEKTLREEIEKDLRLEKIKNKSLYSSLRNSKYSSYKPV